MERVQRGVLTKSMSVENKVFKERLDLVDFFLKKEWLMRGITGFQTKKSC